MEGLDSPEGTQAVSQWAYAAEGSKGHRGAEST